MVVKTSVVVVVNPISSSFPSRLALITFPCVYS